MRIISYIVILLIFCFILPVIALGEDDNDDAQISGIKAENIKYDSEKEIIFAVGSISIVIDDYIINADKITYDIKRDIVFAEGNVKIIDSHHKTIIGNSAVFKDRLRRAIISEFAANLGSDSIVTADNAQKIGDGKFSLSKASFTSCDVRCGKTPIWQIDAERADINYDRRQMIYRNVWFEVYGVPILYLPFFAHTTPNAPAKSGFLMPKVKYSDLIIPYYYRARPNVDFTISPRFSKHYTIFQGEARHRVKYGTYKVDVSVGNPIYREKEKDKEAKEFRTTRYYIFTKGDFHHNQYNYGFNINRVSDKSYLKNYYERGGSYLESKVYLHKIKTRDYFSSEWLGFQGLRESDSSVSDPIIFPEIRTQNIIALNNSESILLNVKNNFVIYDQTISNQLQRESLELALSTNLVSNHGHLVNVTLANRGDIYFTNFENRGCRNTNGQKTLSRTIPEFQTTWRYPMVNSFNSLGIKIEPIIMTVFGKKYESKYRKFGFIDASKHELSEDNIFLPSRYSGIDYHEYGHRFSYGLDTSIYSGPVYIDGFLGQLVHKYNSIKKDNAEYVSSLLLGVTDGFETIYRTRKSRKLEAIRDELGVLLHNDKLSFSSNLVKLNKVSRYYAGDGFITTDNKVKQIYFLSKYQIINNFWVGLGARLDLLSRKNRMLDRTIEVTYIKDCVRIDARIYDDFTYNPSIGIKQNRSKTFEIGLKAINI